MNTFITSLVLSACVAVSAIAEENWPQFRGPGGQGISDSKGLPTTWSESKNVKWKTPIHDKGWSSPVIWGEQVWLTTAAEDGRYLYVMCIDKGSGKIVHDIKLFEDEAPNPIFKKFNSYASPTPVIEEGRVYVTFGSAGTACLDTKTAAKLWERRDLKINHYRGAGSSLFMHGDLLFLNFDGSDQQFIIALDKKSGNTVWKKNRSIDYRDLDPKTGQPQAEGDFRKSFSTCRIAKVDGKELLISAGAKATYAYEPATGNEVWRFEHRDWHSSAGAPVIGDGLIYVAPGFSKGALLAINPKGSGLLEANHLVFKISLNAPNKPSPVLIDGLLYMVSDAGFATCIDAKAGAEVWKQRLNGNFSASLVAGDGKIFFFSEKGLTTVLAVGKEFNKLAENTLDDGCMATPAISGKALFIRTKQALYRVEE